MVLLNLSIIFETILNNKTHNPMKKFYSILAGTLFVASAFGQAPLNTSEFKEATKKRADRQTRTLNTNSSRSIISNATVNFVDMSSSYYSSTPDYDLYYVFPDSTVNADFGGTYDYPFCSSLAMTFDLSSEVINSSILSLKDGFDPAATSTLDSIAVYSNYTQGRDGIVDTVIYRVITGTSGVNLSREYYFTGQATSYPSSNDTTRFIQLLNDGSGVIAEYKVPLLPGDTLSNGLQYPIAVTGGLTVPSIFAITIDYKPGGTYTPFVDTLGERIGSFSVYTAELNGDGTFSNFLPNDHNGSSWVNNSSKYDAASSWYGWYIPYLAYSVGQFESIDMDIVLSQTNSISVIENESDAALFQNYPNPSNGITTVRYSLENEANISFEMIDVTGKKVVSTIEGNKNPGVYSIEVNTAELNSGIYFYSILVNGNKITKKMIVTK
jgi:hypothetical protein